ncbi:thioredoxin family protein [Candidatus Woesebacteria bacterium]|nr:thioredoxin family protein [Candidatus Woesebacteria bacterium]MCD8507771.1 thioredoxin family protein [Candidatus Woesebacteria bacterium]MCD8526958.1 thioredoxin family protein [Candidatus Woesebacteria bacterium]MCD8545871.1 thioredoxin family protein [Candidatus Woesebacteria bacterium]
MQKFILPLIILGIILVFGGFAAYTFVDRPTNVLPTPSTTAEPKESIAPSETPVGTPAQDDSDPNETTSGAQYVAHTPGILAETANSRRVLFFYANWCPTCRPADADFAAQVESLPDDVTVIRVNYDDSETSAEERQLANQYSVTYQHTFVQIDSSGEVVTTWNGGQTDTLLKNIQ